MAWGKCSVCQKVTHVWALKYLFNGEWDNTSPLCWPCRTPVRRMIQAEGAMDIQAVDIRFEKVEDGTL